jgi:hypothetical protein
MSFGRRPRHTAASGGAALVAGRNGDSSQRPLKDVRARRLLSVFGTVEVRAPRFLPCQCAVTRRRTMRVGARLEQQAASSQPAAPAAEARAISLSIDGSHGMDRSGGVSISLQKPLDATQRGFDAQGSMRGDEWHPRTRSRRRRRPRLSSLSPRGMTPRFETVSHLAADAGPAGGLHRDRGQPRRHARRRLYYR